MDVIESTAVPSSAADNSPPAKLEDDAAESSGSPINQDLFYAQASGDKEEAVGSDSGEASP